MNLQSEEETVAVLTERQRRIAELLTRIHEDLAKMYLGALRAYADTRNPDSLSQTAHSLRELANNLPSYMGIVLSKRFDVYSRVNQLLCDWESITGEAASKSGDFVKEAPLDSEDIEPGTPVAETSVPAGFYNGLCEFFEDYASSRLTHRKKVRMLLDSLEPTEAVDESLILEPVVRHWVGITDWFVGICHHGRVERKEFNEKLDVFERGLFAMLSSFYAPLEEIDTLLQIESPAASDGERAQALFKKREHVRYFFENLRHAGWIKRLRELGYFKDPPRPIVEDGYIRFPSWPESRYLKRVAPDEPDEVIDTMIRVPETENARIHNDFMEALLAMPANISAKMVGEVKQWVRKRSSLLLPQNLGKLIAKLATEGEVDAALDLSHAVLQPIVEQPPKLEDSEKRILPFPPIAIAHFDDWFYSRILEGYYPALVEAEPKRAFVLLCQKLKHSIQLELRKDMPRQYDASHIWRPAIESHIQNRGTDDVKNALVSALRDAGEEILRSCEEDREEYLDVLLSFDLPVFKRLELHILRVFATWFSPRIAKRLGDKNLFEDVRCHHEYVLLLSEQFGSLPSDIRESILGWIEDGPQTERFDKLVEKEKGRPPSKQETDRFVERWQLERLHPISDHLPKVRKGRHDELVAKYGKPEHPDFLIFHEFRAGPRSPLSKEDIQTKTPNEVLKFIREWKPSGGFLAPSREGLGRILGSAMSKNPQPYLEVADEFKKDLAPTYMRALLSALREACRNGVVFEWESALDLCAWVVDQPKDYRFQQAQEDEDADWVPSRKAVTDLLAEGFIAGDSWIPFVLRDGAWQVLAKLVEDPDPTPEYEMEYGGRNMNPVNLCINSVRGQAMHATIRYALWVVSNLAKETEFKRSTEPLLSMVPEVRGLLDARLDPKVEPSAAVHSVFGEYLPSLFRLDKSWVMTNISRIFPEEESLENRRDAAWGAYIRYCPVYDAVALALEDEYKRELERIGERGASNDEWHVGRSLADHLVIGYWRGLFGLESDSLISEFFEMGRLDLRAYAIFFIGRNLLQTKKGTVSGEILNRLEKLWSARLEAAKASHELASFEKELPSFGPWAASSHFDTSSCLELLRETLSITSGRIRMSDRVVEYLALVGSEFPNETVECLNLMLRGDDETFAILTTKEETGNVLEVVMASSNAEAKEKASNLVNYVGERGFHGFRNLLNT